MGHLAATETIAGEKEGGAPPPPGYTAVNCLAAVGQHHGLRLNAASLIHEHALGADEPSSERLAAMARAAGLKARAARLDWDGLGRLGSAFPALARLARGNWVIVAGFGRDGDQVAVAVMDPLAGPGLLFVAPTAFQEAWPGEVVLLKRDYALADPDQPFGLKWFIPEILRQKAVFRDVAVAALAMHVLALASPLFFQLVVDKVLVHQGWSTLYALTAGVVLALLFDAGFGWLRQTLLMHATSKIDIRLATRTFRHLLDLPIDFFERNTAGVVARHMQQVDKIRQFLTGRLLLTALDATALVVFVPLLLAYSPKLAALVLVFAALVGAVVVALTGTFRRRLSELYAAEGERQAMLVEAIHGMRTVKSLAVEPAMRRQWDRKAAAAVETHQSVAKLSALAQAAIGFLDKVMLVAVIGVGAGDVFAGTLTVGALMAFQMLSGRVVQPLVQMVSLAQDYQETALSVRMLGEVMNRPAEGQRGGGLMPNFHGAVGFEDVGFRYPGSQRPALAGANLTVPAGQVVGIVGKSGSGKSTLTKLLQGLYAPEHGMVRVDGVDLREVNLTHLRRSIGVVLQENFLFRGSVRDNIAMTKPEADFAEIVAAAQLAGADEFIERLPHGYDSILEENGANLSGGQRQRLAIARALLPSPPILVLDEATSALDPDSEAIIMANLGRIATGRTVIIVSHRLTTLVDCDSIAVVDQGRVIDQGRHGELLQRSPLYAHLWHQQIRNGL
jgi:ATP-binding cassette subfamily B protein